MAYLGKTPSQAVRSRYYYTAAGSETSLSGADDNNNTLIFTDGNYVDVYLNGVLLVSDTDYNTTTANTISGLAALAANDIVEIVVYDTFSVFGGEVKGDFNVTNGTLTADFEGTFTFQAKNTSGAGISKGTPVYISGHSGNSAEIGVADANDPAKMPSFGIAAEAIGNNLTGKVVSYGNLKEIDTSAFAVGDELYVSNTGTLTATRPTGTSDAVQKVAKVIRSHASVGQLFVMGAGRTNDIPNSTSNNIQFADNAKAQFGSSNDLQIYHDGSASYIKDAGTGQLNISGSAAVNIQDTSGNNMLRGVEGAQAALFYAGSQKMQTTSGGIDVTGSVTADGAIIQNSSAAGTQIVIENTSAITSTDYKIVGGKVGVSNEGFSIYDSANATTAYYIDSSGNHEFLGGNVGIGTTSPTADLHISYGSGSGLLVEDTTNSPSVKSVVTSGNTESYFGATSNHPLVFLQNNTERMRITSAGDIAFGNTSANLVSNTSTQGGGGYVASDRHFEFATNSNRAAVEIGKNNANDGILVAFRKQGTSVGSIGYKSTDLFHIGSGDTTLAFYKSGDAILPRGTDGAARSNTIDLGNSGSRFKNLYLSGGVYVGGTGSANYLDDYEEGTFTPTLKGQGTAGSSPSGSGYYTKVGDLVFVAIKFNFVTVSGAAGSIQVAGLPFTVSGTDASATISITSNLNFSSSYIQGIQFSNSTTNMDTYENRSGSNPADWNITNTSNIIFVVSGCYKTT